MRALLLGLMLLPTMLAAEVIPVRSGAHDGFTRLVLDLPQPLDWDLRETAEGYDLRVEGGPHSFDTGAVFQRIDRSRLAALDDRDGTLVLTLACPCRADAFLAGERMLVVDLRDGAPQEAATPLRLDPRADYSRLLEPVAGSVPVLRDPSDPSVPSEPAPERAARDARVEATRAALARALGEAASNGLLSLSEPEVPVPVDAAAASDPGAPEEATPPLDPAPEPPATRLVTPGLAARTGLTAMTGTDLSERASCLPSGSFDMPPPTGGSSFAQQIGAARRALYSERDRINPEAALGLARIYVAHGFGAEALAVLDLVTPGQRPDALAQMARVLETGPDETVAAPLLRAQQACDTPGALWGLLASRSEASPDLNEKAVLTTLNAMPPALRETLGPRVADAFLAAGHPEAAAAATAIVTRVSDAPPPGILLTKAEVDIAEGDLPEAIAGFETAARSNGPSGARAVAGLIDTQLSAGAPVSRDTALLAAAHEREHRDTALGDTLSVAHARALAASGDYTGALAAADGKADIVSDTYRAALAANDELAFIAFAVPERSAAEALLDDAVARQVSERLLEAGFPDPAARFLSGAGGATDRDTRLLRARILLAEGDARGAEALLLGLTGAVADSLRVESLMRQGERSAARDLAQRTGLPWPPGGEADGAEPDLQALREAGAAPPDTATGTDAPLAAGRALLEDSATLRDQIEGLLARRPVPPAQVPPENGGS